MTDNDTPLYRLENLARMGIAIVMAAILITSLIFIQLYIIEVANNERLENQAVENGYAEWVSDKGKGPVFKWKPNVFREFEKEHAEKMR